MAQPRIPATLSHRRWVILSEVAVAQLMVVPRFHHRERRPAVGPAGAGISGSIGASALSTTAFTAVISCLTVHHTGLLVSSIAAPRGYTLASRCPRGCSGSVRSSRSSCCRPGSGLRNSGTRPRRRLLPRPRDADASSGTGIRASGHPEGQSGESARKPQRADYQRGPRQPRAVRRRIQRRTAAAPRAAGAPTERRAQERHDRQPHDLQTSSAMTSGPARSQRQAIPVDDPKRPPLDEAARRALIARSVALGPHYRTELPLPGAQR
jgi:hypothetical protein